MDLYCLNYNNYYNRIIKKEETIDGYLPYLLDRVMTNIAFNPSDGVTTNQILNWNDVSMPDYIVVSSGTEIVSRWFVIEMSRTRNGQYSLVLKRDLIVDHYQPIINAPCFIEKATLNQDDPMIFNSEDMTFNQIKTSETLLKDKSGCGWIVGYYSKDYVDPNDSNVSLNLTGNNKVVITRKADIQLSGDITTWDFYQNTLNEVFGKPESFLYVVDLNTSGPPIGNNPSYFHWYYKFNETTAINPTGAAAGVSPQGLIRLDSNITAQQIRENMDLNYMNSLINRYYETETEIENIKNNNGKVIGYIENGKNVYKKIKLQQKYYSDKFIKVLYESTLGAEFDSGIEPLKESGKIGGMANDDSFKLSFAGIAYKLILEDYSGDSVEVKVASKNNRYNVDDQPYSMFAIPYGEITIKNTGATDWNDFVVSPATSLATAYKIAEVYSGANVLYDLQLLPYCPFQSILDTNSLDLGNDSRLFSLIKNEDGINKSVIINCLENTFSFNIDYEINVENKKIENLTNTYRLCSPNFNGNFEFNPAKNNGINFFNVDCEYKPFSPYIHLNPNFKGLYGSDYNDARGLICGGDFSLTQISDNWNTYQIQNKNFQEMFDRQIQSMEVNNSVQKEKDIWNAISGTVQAGISGATSGGLMAGPQGAVIGSIAGAGVSAIAGIRDIQLNQKLRNEALDYTKDQFGYQLGNIKALPDNLTKVSSFNPNNKIFPILEFYTCTDVEKLALENKLKYNGMTVMRIGTIAEFIRTEITYIKGKLIRLEGISDDFHIINEISNEIFKGVFI